VDIEYVSLNLTSLSSVKTAAERVESRTDSLDVLVLNAGVMAMPMSTTEAGSEVHMGTNHIGHHLLTRLLLPLLEKTAAERDSDVRVVTVSSEGHRLAPPIATITSTAALSELSPLVRYAASKAANVLFAAELARRHPSLTSVSLHPGVIMTDLHTQGRNDGDLVLQGLKALSIITTQSVENGALTQLWCAAGARKDDLTSGGYYTVETLRQWNGWAMDEVAGRKLWDWTEGELARSAF
jgi:NAD(P)-dependent dehydrogenase (short-subunit alcohol dehydrogenase family)